MPSLSGFRGDTRRILRCLLLGLLAGPVITTAFAQPKSAASLKDETRLPWTRSQTRFIRQWQVLGEVPSATADAFAVDPIAGTGGEAALKPGAPNAVSLRDGTALHWRPVTAWGDAVDLSDGNGLKRHVAAYAFTSVTRPAAGKALLCLGSDESLRVWVNGRLVADRRGPRPLTFDDDRIEVDLMAGENALLVKVEQHDGPWTVAARVLEPGAVPPRVQEISPSFHESTPSTLVVSTDATPAQAAEAPVAVTVVAPGGRILAEQSGARGSSVKLDAAGWPDGPYEIRCRTQTLAGQQVATHLPWFKGDAIAAARRLVEAAASADAGTESGQIVKMLADMVRDRLGQEGLATTGNPWWAIHAPLMEYEELRLESAGNATAREREFGFVRLGWRDEIDGSPQFTRVYLPGGYRRDKKWPVVVNLHGYNPANPDIVRWWGADSRHSLADANYGQHEGIIYIEPHGRGNTQYLGLGDQDVLRNIELAKRRFSVDEDRIYLTGGSMGGWGVWNVATRHPQLFAAIAPVFGGADYHSFLPEDRLATLSPHNRFLQEKQSSWSMAEGLGNLPILVVHGDADQAVNIDFSRYGVHLLQRWGFNVRFHELPGYGHEELGEMTNIIDWLVAQRREPNPRKVRLRSAELQHATAYWVTVNRFDRPDAFAVVDAEITGRNAIRLDTQNALTVTLSPAATLVDPAAPVQIVWNGAARTGTLSDGRIELGAEAAATGGQLEKSASLPGAIGDIFNLPFAIVVGTASADPAMKEQCRLHGDSLEKYWREWQRQPPRRFTDTELSDAEAARYSLILIGGPDANLVTRKFADRLPLQVAADRIVVGDRTFAATDARVQMIRPNPLNPQRYVLVVAGTSAAGFRLWGPGRMSGTDFDFLIEDNRVNPAGPDLPPSRFAVASGWFDRTWKSQDVLTIPGDAAARSGALVLQLSSPPANLARYVGRFEIAPGAVLQVTEGNGRLQMNFNGQQSSELIPAGDNRLYVAENSSVLVFQDDAAGKPVSFTTALGQQSYTGKRIE